MENLSLIVVFGVGILGAIAPEIVRGFNLRFNRRIKWSWVYLIMSVPFALLGGVIALILPATTLWGAFYAGLSTPIVVNTALRQTVARKESIGNVHESDRSTEQAQVLDAADDRARFKSFILEL